MNCMSLRYCAGHTALLFSAAFLSCNDPLPDYKRPENVFIAGFSYLDTVTARYGGTVDPPQEYVYFSPPYQFVIWVQNIYEETLQG